MTVCFCPEGPRCQYHHCTDRADWSVLTPPRRWIKTWPYGRLHFMCTSCKDYYIDACSKPLKGIDRPEGADEDWKPSILEHIRHAAIAIAFEERKHRAPDLAPDRNFWDAYWRDYDIKRGFTPAQCAMAKTYRELIRKHRSEQR